MAEFLPDGEAEIADGNRLAICDEDGFACSGRSGAEEVADSEEVGFCSIGHVNVVLKIGSGAQDERCFAVWYASVEGGYYYWVGIELVWGVIPEGIGNEVAFLASSCWCPRSPLFDI